MPMRQALTWVETFSAQQIMPPFLIDREEHREVRA